MENTEDFFNMKELLKIYEQAGSTDCEALRAAARELYPDRSPSAAEQIGVRVGGGRAFLHGDKGYENPAFAITSGKLNWVGIMEDGTAYPYYDMDLVMPDPSESQ